MTADEPRRVPDSRLHFDADQVFTLDGEPFTGIGYEYEDALGGGLSEISYVDGAQTGPARDWSPDGVLKVETYFREGSRHGSEREFDDSGAPVAERHYEYGILVRSFEWVGGARVPRSEIQPSDPNYDLLNKLRREMAWPAPTIPDA